MAAGLSFLRSRPLAARIANAVRSYGAAAAAVFDDDYYYDDDDDYHHDRTARVRRSKHHPMVDGEGSEKMRGVQWVIVGEPGARKHVYAEWLSKLLDMPHISMGSLVRQELNPNSFLYKQVENAVNQGKLVSEDVVFGLLSKKLEEGYIRGETGFILDGIPRTRTQAEILDQIADIDLVLNLKCADKHLAKSELGNKFNVKSQGNWIRSFPEEAAWKEKLRTYAEQSKPLEDYYRKQNKLLDFQVAGAPGETWQGLLSVLQLQHMNSSFQKLTA